MASAAGPEILVWSTESRQVVARYTNRDGAISGLVFSPVSNLLSFTSLDGTFSRWTDPVPGSLPSPITSDAAQAKKIEKLLDDEFGEDEDMEEKGEDLVDDLADDWIVDDDGAYGADDGEKKKWGAERTEVGTRVQAQFLLGPDKTQVNVTKAQSAFIPGSTSMKNKKRYLGQYMFLHKRRQADGHLAFNMIGAVDITDQESHNVVNVEFHDKSARRGYHF